MVKGFSKMYNFSFFGQIYFADSKSRAQDDVSFVIFGHKTWDLEGGVKLTPPQHILVFMYPSRDRVN